MLKESNYVDDLMIDITFLTFFYLKNLKNAKKIKNKNKEIDTKVKKKNFL